MSHVAQDTARAWSRGVGPHCAVLGAFWRLFGPFLGHIVELKGTRGLLDTGKSSRTWSEPPFSFVWAFCAGFGAVFGEKWLLLAQNCADLGGHLPTWRPRPVARPGEFLAQNLDLGKGHHLGSKDGYMGK